MTNEEFNVKYKDYLEDRYYGLSITISSIVNFLDGIFEDLIKVPGFKYYQIKMKFGTARVYTTLSKKTEYLIEEKINQLYKEYQDERGAVENSNNRTTV